MNNNDIYNKKFEECLQERGKHRAQLDLQEKRLEKLEDISIEQKSLIQESHQRLKWCEEFDEKLEGMCEDSHKRLSMLENKGKKTLSEWLFIIGKGAMSLTAIAALLKLFGMILKKFGM